MPISGDHLKKIMVLMAALCLAALSLTVAAQVTDAQNSENLTSYGGNLSGKNLDLVSMPMFFGQNGLAIAEAVKFKAPKAGWKLNKVDVLAWDGYNGTAASIPKDRIIALEIRDKDLNLLYRFADSQRSYSNYLFNATSPLFMNIELPAIPVSDEFYVCFYDRGAVVVMSELLNETSENSYLFNPAAKQIVPATVVISENQTQSFNWIMQVSGS